MDNEEIGKLLAQAWIPVVAECQVCACRDCIKRPCPRCDDCDAPLVVCPDASLKLSPEAGRLLLEEV